MPNIKAAEKWALQSEKRRLRNVSAKTRVRTLTKKAATGGPEDASAAEASLDAAAAKGIIHKNKAARKKSRLAKAIRLRTGSDTGAAGSQKAPGSGRKR